MSRLSGASHSYGDSIAWGGSPLARIDARVKIAGAASLLTVNLTGRSWEVPALIALSMVLVMVAGSIPYRRQLVAVAFPASFALFAVASQTVFTGDSVFASVGPVDLHGDGLLHGLYLSLRIVAGGLVVVILGVSTPINRLCQALRWFRVPATFVEIMQIVYRYLFDTYGELARMRQAQRARLGWSSTRKGLASSRMLGGALFMRVYERGIRSSEAMRCRGAGPLDGGPMPAPGRLDAVAALSVAALVTFLVCLSFGRGGA